MCAIVAPIYKQYQTDQAGYFKENTHTHNHNENRGPEFEREQGMSI